MKKLIMILSMLLVIGIAGCSWHKYEEHFKGPGVISSSNSDTKSEGRKTFDMSYKGDKYTVTQGPDGKWVAVPAESKPASNETFYMMHDGVKYVVRKNAEGKWVAVEVEK